MELLKFMTKTDLTNVSYRGTAPAMTDVVSGVVDVMFTGPPSAKAMSEGGKLKVMGVAAQQRSKLLPDVPTMEEAGVPGYELTGWFGLLAPAGAPKPVIDRLSREVRRAVADPRFADRIVAQGLDVAGTTSEEMLAMMRADTKKWADLIKSAGIQLPQ
jgi:tripartite-type tricarboxylate transporter receptor subunit TctC